MNATSPNPAPWSPTPSTAPRLLRVAAMTLALAAALPGFAQEAVGQSIPPQAAAATSMAATPAVVLAAPAFDITQAVDIDAPASESLDLAPGEYLWTPERAGPGQVVVVVSLPEQRAHVYRHGVRIGVSTISSGKPGNETPTGVFPILQKREEHYSNLYNNAPMPYMQRLTWDGIALHAGKIPGYPASHGCVRLPLAFAKELFAATERGVTVVVADETSHGAAVVWPGERAPVDAYSGLELGAMGDMAATRTVPDSIASN